jgi:SAM-dependent methyltransferase
MNPAPLMSPELALPLVNDPDIIWYQRFPLAEGILTPGERDIDELLGQFELPNDLSGMSVLDIGTTNGGVAFHCERHGAERVVTVDIHAPGTYGFAQIAEASGSRVHYVRASIYELPTLRHPLLAVDAIHTLSRGQVYVETEVSSAKSGVDFYAGEYRGDTSNWFVPSEQCVLDWFSSSGFAIETVALAPGENNPVRGSFVAKSLSGPTQWELVSYERKLSIAALDWNR